MTPQAAELIILIADTCPDTESYAELPADGMSPTLGRPAYRNETSFRSLERLGLINRRGSRCRITEEGRLTVEGWREGGWPVAVAD